MKFNEALTKNLDFLTDGGLETTFIFDYGINLPEFAAFPLVLKSFYREKLMEYYRKYLDISLKYKKGFILESPTWRASKDWGEKLNYDEQELFVINQRSITLMESIRDEYKDENPFIYISGCVGPRSDAYNIGRKMTIDDAVDYHLPQIKALKSSGADFITALTINYLEEGLGIVMAAQEANIPVVISFTVEKNGKLCDGRSLEDAIMDIDWCTGSYPLYYMVNCAHPSHYLSEINTDNQWIQRIKGCRSNASSLSHEELDASDSLQQDPMYEFTDSHILLKTFLPGLKVFGGCCGSDHNHVEGLCQTFFENRHMSEMKEEGVFE